MGKGLPKDFIEEQYEKLLSEKKKIKDEIEKLEKEDPFQDPERLTDNKEDEDAREEIGHETVVAQIKTLKDTLSEIEKAFKKIENATYGKCERCGRYIEIERLKVAPAARFCIACQRKMG